MINRINLGAAFPKQLITVVIYKEGLAKFTEPEKTYLNKKVSQAIMVLPKDNTRCLAEHLAQMVC